MSEDTEKAIALVDAPDPWDQLPGESDHCYAAFITYRDHPTRRIRDVWRALEARGIHFSETSLYDWRNAYGWVERARAWSLSLQRAADDAKLQAIEDMNTRHGQIAGGLLDIVDHGIQAFKDDPEKVKATKLMELTQTAQMATQIERKALGVGDQARADTKPMFQIVIHTSKDEPRVIEGERVE